MRSQGRNIQSLFISMGISCISNALLPSPRIPIGLSHREASKGLQDGTAQQRYAPSTVTSRGRCGNVLIQGISNIFFLEPSINSRLLFTPSHIRANKITRGKWPYRPGMKSSCENQDDKDCYQTAQTRMPSETGDPRTSFVPNFAAALTLVGSY